MEYEEIELLKQSEKSTVQLVREKDGEQLYVRKVLQGYQPIYLLLQICVHPGLPKLYDVDMSDNVTTLREEYIEGETLGSVELSKKQFLNVVKELCSVLNYLHGKGIIHRDIKPSNILLAADGHIRLIDFDAARMPKADYDQDTRLLGTRGYAPPEQYGFEQTDARADIYALGVTLQQILTENIQNPRYNRIIRKCIRLDPDKRYQSVRQLEKAFFHKERTVFCVLSAVILGIVFYGYVQYTNMTPKSAETMPPQANSDTQNADMKPETAAPEKTAAPEETSQEEKLPQEENGLQAASNVAEEYPDRVLWNGILVNSYFGRNIEEIMEEWGTPLDQYENDVKQGWCSYSGIVFCFDEEHRIYELGVSPEMCTYNGEALNASWEKLPEILGEPERVGQQEDTGYYYMGWSEWLYDGTRIYLAFFKSIDEAPYEIWVTQVS